MTLQHQTVAKATSKHRASGFEWIHRDELPNMLNALGLVGVGAEVGCGRFNFGAHVRRHWQGKLLIEVDDWAARENVPHTREQLLQAKHDAIAWIDESLAAVELIEMPSVRAARHIAALDDVHQIKRLWSGGLDWIYLDANPAPKSIAEDIAVWYPLLRSGGVFCGSHYVQDGWYRPGDPQRFDDEASTKVAPFAVNVGVMSALKQAFPGQSFAKTTDAVPSWAFIKP